MVKEKCLTIFNNLIRGEPVSWKEEVIPLIYDYLTEFKLDNYEKIINLIKQNPQISSNYLGDAIVFFCRKYNILSIIFNNKTILYYE